MNETTYTISKHAKERYAARILNKDNNNEIQSFIVQNEDKMLTDITKMITYGELIFSGKQSTRDNKSNTVHVYLNGCWIVLVDAFTDNVITLYKVDLGCGDDFNTEYVTRMLEQINKAKDEVSSVQLKNINETNMYREMIEQNISQINEYKKFIKNLEALNDSYKQIIDNNTVHISQANKEVAQLVNKLIGKKEF